MQRPDRPVRGVRPSTSSRAVTPASPGRRPARPGPRAPRAGVPGRDHPAEVEHDDRVGQPHHHAHVVLDQQHGHPVGADVLDQPGELVAPPRGTGRWPARRACSSRGAAASARASSIRFSVPYGRPAAGRAAMSASAEPVQHRVGPVGAAPAPGPGRRAAAARRPGSRRRRRPARRASRSPARVSEGTRPRCWKVRATPSAATRCAGSASRSRPASSIRPDRGRVSRLTQSKSVVLPAPFGPISPQTSPGVAR